jgi:hypothetical protein
LKEMPTVIAEAWQAERNQCAILMVDCKRQLKASEANQPCGGGGGAGQPQHWSHAI